MFDVANNNALLHIQDMFRNIDAVHTYNSGSRTSKNLFCKFQGLKYTSVISRESKLTYGIKFQEIWRNFQNFEYYSTA